LSPIWASNIACPTRRRTSFGNVFSIFLLDATQMTDFVSGTASRRLAIDIMPYLAYIGK
jgi:hypothetical protein